MDEDQTIQNRNTPDITWQTLEHKHSEKSSDWYWVLGIITLALSIASLILGNFTFALLILIGAFALALIVSKKPESIEVELSKKGVKVNDVLYLYKSLDGFWIDKETNKLILKSKKTFMPMIVVSINEEIDPEMVEHYLVQFLHEEEMDEPFYSKLSDKI